MWAIVNERTGSAWVMSKTEKGIKNYATRHGYFVVCQVNNHLSNCYNFKVKKGKQWVDDSNWLPHYDFEPHIKTS